MLCLSDFELYSLWVPLISVIASILFKIYLWNTSLALSINQCFLKIKCEGPWCNFVTHCKAVLSGSRLALSTKPILGGGFVCCRASEFSAEAELPYQPKLSSLDTAPAFGLNWQLLDPDGVSICRVYSLNSWEKRAVTSVPTCPRMLTYSIFLQTPVPTNEKMLKSLKFPRR